MPAETTTHTAVFSHVRWRAAEDTFLFGQLEDAVIIAGRAEDGELVPGLTYQFHGRWDARNESERRFNFSQFVQHVPHSRSGVVAYLERYAPNVGPAVAARLWDAFGADAVKTLRTDPKLASAAVGQFLSLAKAEHAAKALTAIAALEDTKIALVDLFAGRGFPGSLPEECIRRLKILAPARIRRDPFWLLVNGLPGCGFARCDRLYTDLGLPAGRLKRQMICLWHLLHGDTSGNTWMDADLVVARLGELVSGAKIEIRKAVLLGCRSGWLAKRRDEDGKLWLAEGDRAKQEKFLAAKLLELSAWEMPFAGETIEVSVVRPALMIEHKQNPGARAIESQTA